MSHNEVCTCRGARRNEQERVEMLRSMNWQQRQQREHSWLCVNNRVMGERQQRYKEVRELKKKHQRVINKEVTKEQEEKRLQHDYILDQQISAKERVKRHKELKQLQVHLD